MKRVSLLITVGIFVVTAIGIWYYQYVRQEKISPWDLVSENAAFVLEIKNLQSSVSTLKTVPPLEHIVETAKSLNTFLKIEPFTKRRVLISAHPVRRDNFDFLIYTEIGTQEQVSTLKAIEKYFQKPYSLAIRSYNGRDILEATLDGKPFCSITAMEGILVASNSSFLIEGAIRIFTSESSGNFRKKNLELFKLPSLQSDEGDVYVNLKNFGEYLHTYLSQTSSVAGSAVGTGVMADLKFSKNQILLNGFLTDRDSSLLSLFRYQRPQEIEIEHLVSNRTAILTHYGFTDPGNWFEQQLKMNAQARSAVDSLTAKLKLISVDMQSIRNSVGSQFANAFGSIGRGDVVSFLRLSDAVGSISVFDELASKISTSNSDSLYLENYAGYEIKLIDQKDFLYQLLYPLADRAERSFFCRIGQFILFAENVEQLKRSIDDIDAENTWGKSVDWNKYLSSSQRESNVNLFFDGRLLQFFLGSKLNSTWKPFFDSTSFLGIDRGSIQISRLDENYYLNSSIQFIESLRLKKASGNLSKIAYDFGSKIRIRPQLVRSHTTKDIEVFVQDSSNQLYFASKDLKVQWKAALPSPILNRIEAIDYFKNGKLQYLVVSEKSVDLFDRLGRKVDPFPINVNEASIQYSKVIDYDKSRNYRFLLTDRKGPMYLLDKSGSLLGGWNPRNLDGNHIETPRHFRILGRDYFIGVLQSGIVQVLNRRGESAKGFPYSLPFRPSGAYFVDVGTIATTNIALVGQDGLFVRLGLDGQLVKRDVLLKRTASSNFLLVKSQDDKSFVIVRIDADRIAVLDSNGEMVFEFENPGSDSWEIEFVESRLKNRFFCFYDRQQNFSFFFDENGRSLINQPLESSLLPTLFYNDNVQELSIYNVDDSEVSHIKIKE